MYVCMYVCIYVCMYASMYVSMYVCIHVYIHIYLYIYRCEVAPAKLLPYFNWYASVSNTEHALVQLATQSML